MRTIRIGNKLNRKMIGGNILKILLVYGLPLWCITRMFYQWFPNLLSVYLFYFSLLLLGIFLSMSTLSCTYLEVTETHFIFNEALKKKELMEEILSLFTSSQYVPAIFMKLDSIKAIQLNYKKTLVWGLSGYIVCFKCLLSDGTVIHFSPKDMRTKYGDLLQLIDVLESHQIPVYDPYHIKPGLIKGGVYFQEYMKKLEKGATDHD